MTFKLKSDFKLGVATSSMQIEGGECNSSWNNWYHQGKIKDGSNPARATDHYNRWKEDADIMSDMGIKIYRFGIEWARICPKENIFDESVIYHYKEEMTYLKNKDISLLLTIHHFSNPMWFEEKGGFTKSENNKYYLSFVEHVIRSFGHLISEYITINEPNVYATHSYHYGVWPPGEKSLCKALTVMCNLAVCHIKAYELIHKIRSEMGYDDTKVSFSNYVRIFDSENPKNPFHVLHKNILELIFNDLITEAMYFGHFKFPFIKPSDIKHGEYCDFLAVNYYSRSIVSTFKEGTIQSAHKNDLGWEIYPDGIIRSARKLYNLIERPIYITENGTCDNKDTFRCKYIYEHLKLLSKTELPIVRYYHWCFCDNFELAEGESARFGLVHINYDTQKRTIKNSGKFYSDIIKQRGVTEEIFKKYVKDQEYHF